MTGKIIKTISVLAATSAMACASLVCTAAFADEKDLTAELIADISAIETQLEEDGTDVVTELYALIAELDGESQNDLRTQNLIAAAQEAIQDYEAYKTGAQTRSIIGNAVYKAAVSTAVAYFNSNDYDLSAELLLHARDNTVLDSLYEPTYGYLVCHSAVFQNIANGTSVSGSASFPNSGDYIDKDLYYSIHAFSYTKPDEESTTVVISDRYDFAEEDNISSVVDLAVGIMYKAQQAGVITPFLITITQSL